MKETLEKLSFCIERGKINTDSPFPRDMLKQEGAEELIQLAINEKIPANDILSALSLGMEKVGIKFRENKVFVPEVLMAAKAMSIAMNYLTPFFQQGIVKQKGALVIGTVAGDLHDIGKNLVAMIIEGSGWKIIDLGTNVSTEKYLNAIEENPDCFVGLSALLTTTMINMEKTVKAIKEKYPNIKVMIGGAPVNDELRERTGADFYSHEPLAAINYLNSCIN
ncbi:B12-binding domain-containing protein [Bacteroidota bacterium]